MILTKIDEQRIKKADKEVKEQKKKEDTKKMEERR